MYSVTVKVCTGVAGVLTFAYSALGALALLGLDLTSGLLKDVLAVYPVLAFPVFLLVALSLRWASVALWVFFILQWVRCCVISWPVLCHNPIDSFAGKMLLAAVLLVSSSFLLSSLPQRRNKAAIT
jgi:hypothetical protein